MSRLNNVRRINTQDFKQEDQETVSKLAEILNFFMDDVVNNVNGNLDYDNLSKNLISINITVDANGTPLNTTSVETGITNPSYLEVKRARNLTNSVIYPTGTPLISYTETGTTVVTLNNITNLQPNNIYNLVIEVA
tara:strand:- start:181 stop:588 length:408 start_codon:yes stop_codon:yes gene_type:complete